jgi:hypothetical protein
MQLALAGLDNFLMIQIANILCSSICIQKIDEGGTHKYATIDTCMEHVVVISGKK